MARSTEFTAIGTHWWIEIFDDINELTWQDLIKQVQACTAQFEADYSRFLPDSFVTLLNNRKYYLNPNSEFLQLIRLGEESKEVTQGAFDIAVGAVLENMGYDAKYSFTAKPAQNFDNYISFDQHKIEIGPQTRIDLGGIGKGFLIDKVKSLLVENEIRYFSINAGGDIYATSEKDKPIDFVLENPFNLEESIGKITIKNKSIASSSGNRRRWTDQTSGKTFHHLVNMQDQKNVADIAAVFTFGDNATNADIASTALFVSPFDLHAIIAETFAVEYLIISTDGHYIKSNNYPGKLN